MTESWQRAGFGLYVHWPFCQAKCPYCDFNSHVVPEIDENRWISAYTHEISRIAKDTGERTLSSIFFGGGTPSLMSNRVVDAVITAAKGAWPVSNSLEVTLEANPTSVEAERFEGYADSGVNRVSVGIQSLRDADLKKLGRLHTVDEAVAALQTAKSVFSRVSFDLIYGRQFQALSDWEVELDEALSLAGEHLSLYQLTIEDGTAFGERHSAGKLPGLPSEDLGADMYELTQSMTAKVGLPAYEISNHAAPDAQARHNLIYWQGGDYAGIGPGAHGRLTIDGQRWATETEIAPIKWLQMVEKNGTGQTKSSVMDAADVLTERLMMGLRLESGVNIDTLPENQEILNNIKYLREDGLIEFSGTNLKLTPTGRPLLNSVLAGILA